MGLRSFWVLTKPRSVNIFTGTGLGFTFSSGISNFTTSETSESLVVKLSELFRYPSLEARNIKSISESRHKRIFPSPSVVMVFTSGSLSSLFTTSTGTFASGVLVSASTTLTIKSWQGLMGPLRSNLNRSSSAPPRRRLLLKKPLFRSPSVMIPKSSLLVFIGTPKFLGFLAITPSINLA